MKLRRFHLKNKCISDSEYEEVNDVYERALTYMNKVRALNSAAKNSQNLLLINLKFKDAKDLDRLLSVFI